MGLAFKGTRIDYKVLSSMFTAKLAVLYNAMQIKFIATMNGHVKELPGMGVLCPYITQRRTPGAIFI